MGEPKLSGEGSIFDQAIAYIRPHEHTSNDAPVSLRAGMLRCAVSAILVRVSELEHERDAALAGRTEPLSTDLRCPFNDSDAPDLPDDFKDEDPCPVCGDLDSTDNGGRPRRCVSPPENFRTVWPEEDPSPSTPDRR